MRGFGLISAGLIWAMAAAASAPARADPPAPYQGLKKTVAVYQFKSADSSSPMGEAAASSADALTAMLTDALIRDGRFVVVEREDLGDIAIEQKLGHQASTTKETAAQAGKMIGASLIINGAVTKYEPDARASSISIGVPVAGGLAENGLGFTHGHALVEIELRVIDSTTGQVLTTVKAQGTAPVHGVNVSAAESTGANVTLSTLKTTPLGQAAEVAIDQAVPKIALAADHQPWSALVIETDGDTVYVNAGAEENLQAGTLLAVRRKTKDLVDPGTGVVLDTLMSDVGVIRIDDVRPKVSTASVVKGGPPARGDLLQLAPQ
jgi:curli biogenesis system outer membrane secretion channel CsgG